jgi:replicative DNA helicase
MRISDIQIMTAEKSALGAAMLEPWAAEQVASRLSPADFQVEANKVIFAAMKKLHGEGKPVDFATVLDECGDHEKVVQIGGLDYVLELNRFVVSAVNIEHYINTIQENSREARIIYSIGEISNSDSPSLPQLEKLVEQEKAAIKPVGNELQTAEAVEEYLEDLDNPKGGMLFLTGFPKFDKYMGGLPRGSLSIIAARPRVGKTAIALNIMEHSIRSGYKTAFFSLEMTRRQLLDRLAAASTEARYTDIHARQTTKEQNKQIGTELVDLLGGYRLNLFDDVRSVSGIVSEIARIKPDIAFIDYAQKVRPDRQTESRHHDIEAIVDRLKEAAIQQNCHICLLSQLSREGAEKPKLEALKESGSLEEGGDIVMLLHRKAEPDGTIAAGGLLVVAKHKYGETGSVDLYFNGQHQKFTEAAR